MSMEEFREICFKELPRDKAGVYEICLVGADGYALAEELSECYASSTIYMMEDPLLYDGSYDGRMDHLILTPGMAGSGELPGIMNTWVRALKPGGIMLCSCDYRHYSVLSFLNLCQMSGCCDVTPLANPVYRMCRPVPDPDFAREDKGNITPRYERVYVLCPSLYRSGGPEVLHQLVHCINVLGGKADIAYVWTEDKEVYGNPDLIHYVAGHICRVEDIPDEPDVAVVAPEIYVEYLAEYVQADTYLWWLSADNFEPTYPPESLGMIWEFIRRILPHNLYQSAYAREFCISRGVVPDTLAPLSDYISKRYLEVDAAAYQDRADRVLYSPKRGLEFTKKLMESAPDLVWVPIEKMSASQVFDLLCHSKVYIDFGTHPGKDRLPREAAMCGCIVITGKRGSAAYEEDVPIPNEYKFDENAEDIDRILSAIRRCLTEYETEQERFGDYRARIRTEKETFRRDAEKSFFIREQAT